MAVLAEEWTVVSDRVEPAYRADLRRARQALVAADVAGHPADRFLAAHLAALRVAAVVLGAAGRRALPAGRRTGRPADVWQVLVRAAPEYAEWAAFFAATRGTWQAVLAGARNVVSERQADDLVRDATLFCDEVSRRLDAAWERRSGGGGSTSGSSGYGDPMSGVRASHRAVPGSPR